MKLVVCAVTALVAIAGSAALAADAGAASQAGLPCTPKITTQGGKPLMQLCGPATVNVTINGKKYAFTQGFCSVSGTTFMLSLGTLVGADHVRNGGKPYFDLIASGAIGRPDRQVGRQGPDRVGHDARQGRELRPERRHVHREARHAADQRQLELPRGHRQELSSGCADGVAQVHHAVREAPLVAQLEREAQAVGQRAGAAADDHRAAGTGGARRRARPRARRARAPGRRR